MIVGVPKEIKDNERRVGMVPAGVRRLVDGGHRVLVQKGAGLGSGIGDDEFTRCGAILAETAEEVYGHAEMVVKVKEPLAPEYPLLREGQILFTFLHLAPDPELTRAVLAAGCIGVAYETIQMANGALPLLTPMSEVAGRMAPQVGSAQLESPRGGRGVLLGGVPGVPRAHVTILGGGVVGANAAKIAVGMGADVHILDVSHQRLAYLDDVFGAAINTWMSNPENIGHLVAQSDLVIGAVLLPGAKAPSLVTREMVASMAPGTVIVDVAIDQGGCVATARPTSHQEPTYVVDGVIHYCVTNIPGAVARTSTFALTNVTLPYALAIAEKGLTRAVGEDPALALGVNVCKGEITHPGVAGAMDALAKDPLACLS